jgi:RNA polymerase sigma-70 factor (ECF subfamily)
VVRDPAPSAETIAIADMSLAAAWEQLHPRYREVLALTAIDGLSVNEAAIVLGVTPNAVSVRLTRARARLAEELSKQN